MTFSESIKTCLTKKFATFSGNASCSEFWYFFLFQFLILVVFLFLFSIVANVTPMSVDDNVIGLLAILYLIICLFLSIPNLAVTIRRLHDTGLSGWFVLISLIPIIGPFLLFVSLTLPSAKGNQTMPTNDEQQEENINRMECNESDKTECKQTEEVS